MKRVVVIASTGGGVLGEVLRIPKCRELISTVVSDRECGALRMAREHAIPVCTIPSIDGAIFSQGLHELYGGHDVGLFISFYTRIFSGRFLDEFEGRILNFHPALLPGFPGLDGFGDTIRSGCRFIGSTVHYVDAGIDTGQPLIQGVTPYNPNLSTEENRHKIFIQHCRMFIQLLAWYREERLVEGRIDGATFDSHEFCPALDDPVAKAWPELDGGEP
ncbi:hypothetical protein LG302_11515 [Halomonas organivorans]